MTPVPALLPLPGAPSASWPAWRARLAALLRRGNTRTLVAFWLFGELRAPLFRGDRPLFSSFSPFSPPSPGEGLLSLGLTRGPPADAEAHTPPPKKKGLINNVLYVVVLAAAQDLVGPLPKGVVLMADVLPSLLVKLVGPHWLRGVAYRARVPALAGLASAGMAVVALAPSSPPSSSSSVSWAVGLRLAGVALASLSSGGGELSFLSLLHHYGRAGLVGWGSGTGLYVALAEWWGLGVARCLLVAACLPALMLVGFFCLLPREPLRRAAAAGYRAVPGGDDDDAAAAVAPPPPAPSAADALRRARALLVPYVAPLFLVYVAEYTINQGVAPTLLFPVEASPFAHLRSFYPFYGVLYQLGVFASRSSLSLVRVHRLHLPALLQLANLGLLTLHALFFFLPSVYAVMAVVVW